MKKVKCGCCGTNEYVTEFNSINGIYPDYWIVAEDNTLRCSWECQANLTNLLCPA